MKMPLQTILFCQPSLIYILVQHLRGLRWNEVLRRVGWQGSTFRYVLLGLGFGLIPGILFLCFPSLLPSRLMDDPNIAQSRYAGMSATLGSFLLAWAYEAFYVALGEEAFFRGFLGGLLIRRLGFIIGNTIQACAFLLPHLLLLTISVSLWPLLLAQYLAGWIQGWLFYRSESILPGWIAHSLSNAFGAFAFMA